jgi:hypothetical protein
MEYAAAYEALLSSAQERFAQEHDARPGMQAPDHRAIFLYRDEPSVTVRWLVDEAGCAEEVATFHRSLA